MPAMSRRSAHGFTVGVTIAGAILAYVPTASAQPLWDCGPLAPQDPPRTAEHQQACDQQQQQPGMPELPDLPDNNPQQAPPAPPDSNNPNGVDLADTDCWVVNGVPTMWSPGLSTPPGQQSWPCYYVYGLTPKPR